MADVMPLPTTLLQTPQMLRQIKPAARLIHTSAPRMQAPVRRVGALRGGFTGFLTGIIVTGGAAYYYLLDEYNAGQQAILADVVTLRSSLRELNDKVAALKVESEK